MVKKVAISRFSDQIESFFNTHIAKVKSTIRNPKNHGPETTGSLIRAPWTKKLKMVKIRKSIFRDFKIVLNQIDYEESENRGPETLGNIPRQKIDFFW